MRQILYHGSTKIIEVPEFGLGNPKNDYGLGFYCTENLDLAKEWASSVDSGGFANEYELDLEGLTVCNLSKDHHILNWMAILLENRTFDLSNGIAGTARNYILDNFLPDYKNFDIIKGYRADDSYFSFAKDFLNNSISLELLSEAMKLGKLGEQIVIKSDKGFNALRFINAIVTDNNTYYPKKVARDRSAREEYQAKKSIADPVEGTYIIDLIRERWTNDDERLR